jgi:hypothetical protein
MKKTTYYLRFLVLGLVSCVLQAQDGWTNITAATMAALPGATYRAGAVCVNRLNGDVYMSFPPLGIFKSTDQGKTWTQPSGAGFGVGYNCAWSINQDQNNPARMADVSCYGSAAISLDGVHFQPLNDLLDGAFVSVDWSDPGAKTMIMVMHGVDAVNNNTINLTTDGGNTWTLLPITIPNCESSGLPGMVGALDDHTFIYIDGASGIMRSTDTAKTWTQVSTEDVQTRTPVMFKGVCYLGGFNGLVISRDKGATWQEQGGAVEIWQGPFFGSDENTMVVVGSNGIYKTTNAGNSWSLISDLKTDWVDKAFYTDIPKFSPNYAWDPVNNVLYATVFRNDGFKKALGPASVDKKPMAAPTIGLLAFPNPFNATTELSFANPFRNAEFNLYGIDGRNMLKVRGISTNSVRIDGKHLVPGVYAAAISVSGKTLRTRLCLAR